MITDVGKGVCRAKRLKALHASNIVDKQSLPAEVRLFVHFFNCCLFMGRNKRNRKEVSFEEDQNDYSSSSPKDGETLSISTLARSFSEILTIVKDNGKKLDGITDQFKSLETRVKSLEEALSGQSQQFSTIQTHVAATENEIINVKSQISVVTAESVFLREENNQLKNRLMHCEYRMNEKNIVVWNVPCDDKEEAKAIFKTVCEEGLGVNETPEFAVTEVKKERRYFKVTVRSKEEKITILKQSKKLKGKTVCGHKDIYLSDDAPTAVRDIRKRLIEKRSKLADCGIQAWVTKSVPPLLCFDRPNGLRVSFSVNDVIPELSVPINPRGGPMQC